MTQKRPTAHGNRRCAGLLLALSAVATGCDLPSTRAFDATRCDASGKAALCFDLDASTSPVAGIMVNSQSLTNQETRTVVLPFEALGVEKVPVLFNTWATHGGATVITYVASAKGAPMSGMGINPVYGRISADEFTKTDLRGTLYLLSSGLKRRFVYRMPERIPGSSGGWHKLEDLKKEKIESVIVRLPPTADIFERHTASIQPIAEAEAHGAKLKIYPYPRAGAPTVSTIDLTYQIPPTSFQNLVFEYSLKFFAVLLIPLVSLAVLTSAQVRAPVTRRSLLIVGFSLQALILGGMLWWAFHIRSVAGPAAVFDVFLAVVGAGLTIALVLVKKEEE